MAIKTATKMGGGNPSLAMDSDGGAAVTTRRGRVSVRRSSGELSGCAIFITLPY